MSISYTSESLAFSGVLTGNAGILTNDLDQNGQADAPEVAQPVCTILQVALVELLESIGVRPTVVIGHSSGEIAAA